MQVGHQPFISVFERYKNAKGKQAKLKAPEELQTFLKAVVEVADGLPQLRRPSVGAVDLGADRDSSALSLSAEQSEDSPHTTDAQEQVAQERAQLAIIRRVLQQGNHFSGINRKVQLKPILVDDATGCVKRLQVIVKWGGVLTHLGRRQAEELGNTYRMVMYPQSADGGGLLRLHSTYRHDLKIYSSDEGRVQTSAAAFAKGLLDLEGESLVSTYCSASRACTLWRRVPASPALRSHAGLALLSQGDVTAVGPMKPAHGCMHAWIRVSPSASAVLAALTSLDAPSVHWPTGSCLCRHQSLCHW